MDKACYLICPFHLSAETEPLPVPEEDPSLLNMSLQHPPPQRTHVRRKSAESFLPYKYKYYP